MEWKKIKPRDRAALAALALAAILYGGAKPPSGPTARVEWDEHFANASCAIDTNDLRRISFAWTAPAWMPQTANAILHAYGLSAGVPDVDEAARAPMSAGAMSAYMPREATNYAYFVECDWTPAPGVVTNGVYHVRAVENAGKVVPVGVEIKTPNQGEEKQ